jgi:hypothetical protein
MTASFPPGLQPAGSEAGDIKKTHPPAFPGLWEGQESEFFSVILSLKKIEKMIIFI